MHHIMFRYNSQSVTRAHSFVLVHENISKTSQQHVGRCTRIVTHQSISTTVHLSLVHVTRLYCKKGTINVTAHSDQHGKKIN